jgi:hypothetical protein
MNSAEQQVFNNMQLCVLILQYVRCYRDRASVSLVNKSTLAAYEAKATWTDTKNMTIEKCKREQAYGLYKVKMHGQTHPNTELVSVRDIFQPSSIAMFAHITKLGLVTSDSYAKEISNLLKNIDQHIPSNSLKIMEIHIDSANIIQVDHVQTHFLSLIKHQQCLKKLTVSICNADMGFYCSLMSEIAKCSQLEYLSIDDCDGYFNPLTIDARKHLMSIGATLPLLQKLYISRELKRGTADLLYGLANLSFLDIIFDYWDPLHYKDLIRNIQNKRLTHLHVQVTNGAAINAGGFFRDICRLIPTESYIEELRIDIVDDLNYYGIIHLIFNILNKQQVANLEFIARCCYSDVWCCVELMDIDLGVLIHTNGNMCIRFSKLGKHVNLHCH